MKQKDWTINDWCKVIFSNESKIEIGCNSQPIWLFRTEAEKYKEECLTPSFKGARMSIMMWGCFLGKNLEPLPTFDKGGISSVEYIQILENGLLPFLERLNGIDNISNQDAIHVATAGEYIFQQDNAPIHNSGPTRAFFQNTI